MKKLIKNYVAKLQENEKKGFSLVELIIVMAIMAILVGIVASQVLPYMDKSRQAKDQQILSSICTDLVSATAQSGKNLGDIEGQSISDGAWDAKGGDGWDTVEEIYKSLQTSGQLTPYANLGLKSKEATKTATVVLFDYDGDTGVITVYLSDGEANSENSHQGDDPDTSKYIVSSSSKSGSSSSGGGNAGGGNAGGNQG